MPQTIVDLKLANAELKRENAALKRDNEKIIKSKMGKASRKPRAPSEYNIFMRNTMRELKSDDPSQKSSVIMTLAAQKWKVEKLKKLNHV